MIYIYILLSFVKSSIILPLRKESNFSPENDPFSARALSYSSSMTNYINYQYSIQACIGTPLQCFSMLVSLKSTWILIGQKSCTQCRSWSKKFDSSSSSTFKNENKYLIFDSVDTFEGYTGFDTVNIAGIDAKSQKIVLVSKESEKSTLHFDGVFGLGFITSSGDAISILNTLYSQGSIGDMVFSIYINDFSTPSDLPNYGDSVLIIDGHNISKYAAESTFTYIKAVNLDGYWQVNFDNAAFDGINITSGYKAIISPGTSFILGPKDAINTILKRLHDNYSCEDDSNGQLYCNCNQNYPDLIIQLTGVKFRIKSAGYLLKADNGYCIPTFDYTPVANTWGLGDAFLRRFYTFYDMENMKIGFATVGKISQITFSNSGNDKDPEPEPPKPSPNDPDPSEPGNKDPSVPGNEASSSSSDNSWKIALILTLSAIGIFIIWIFSLVFIYLKMRESKAITMARMREEENQRRQNGFVGERRFDQVVRFENNAIAEQNRIQEELRRQNNQAIAEQSRIQQELRRQNNQAIAEQIRLEQELRRQNNEAIAEQIRHQQELRINIENTTAELRRLEEQRIREREIAEQRRRDAELNSSGTSYDIISNFNEENAHQAPQGLQRCNWCGKDFDINHIRGLSCGHYFCEEDLRQFLENNIKDNSIERAIKCPYRYCTGKIGSLIIQSVLSTDLWEKLSSYAINRNLSLNNEE